MRLQPIWPPYKARRMCRPLVADYDSARPRRVPRRRLRLRPMTPTPKRALMRQYHGIKQQVPNALLLFRLI